MKLETPDAHGNASQVDEEEEGKVPNVKAKPARKVSAKRRATGSSALPAQPKSAIFPNLLRSSSRG